MFVEWTCNDKTVTCYESLQNSHVHKTYVHVHLAYALIVAIALTCLEVWGRLWAVSDRGSAGISSPVLGSSAHNTPVLCRDPEACVPTESVLSRVPPSCGKSRYTSTIVYMYVQRTCYDVHVCVVSHTTCTYVMDCVCVCKTQVGNYCTCTKTVASYPGSPTHACNNWWPLYPLFHVGTEKWVQRSWHQLLCVYRGEPGYEATKLSKL